MIVNGSGTCLVSNLGWIDRGDLWSYVLGDRRPRKTHISEAKWLSLVSGDGKYFAVVHHFESPKIRVSAHSYEDIADAVSSIDLEVGESADTQLESLVPRFAGDATVWRSLPRAYAVRLLGDEFLCLIGPDCNSARLEHLAWYTKSYDPTYQAVHQVIEVPDSSFLLISIQRDSEPVLYDPSRNKIVRKLELAGRTGNPQLGFRGDSHELWATDYDTIIRLDSRTWKILDALKLQEAKDGMAKLNIGEFCFNTDNTVCAVARPHSGDIVGIDPKEFRVIRRLKTGRQPLAVGLLRDSYCIARDWKSGEVLEETLNPL